MVFFLIFDILCLLASLGMTIMAALMIAIWDTVNERLGGTCYTRYQYDYTEASCTCGYDLEPRDTWTMGKKLSPKFILNKLRIKYSQQLDNANVFADNDLIIASILELTFIIVELDV